MSSPEVGTHIPTAWDHAIDVDFKRIIMLYGTLAFDDEYNDYHNRLERYREPKEAALDEIVAHYHREKHIWEDELGYERTDAHREKLYHLVCAANANRALRWEWHTNENDEWYANPRHRHL